MGHTSSADASLQKKNPNFPPIFLRKKDGASHSVAATRRWIQEPMQGSNRINIRLIHFNSHCVDDSHVKMLLINKDSLIYCEALRWKLHGIYAVFVSAQFQIFFPPHTSEKPFLCPVFSLRFMFEFLCFRFTTVDRGAFNAHGVYVWVLIIPQFKSSWCKKPYRWWYSHSLMLREAREIYRMDDSCIIFFVFLACLWYI